MIQFRRGKTSTWQSQTTPLADGQPGYDKDRNKIKIGNGKDSWENLPDASGLRMDEILVSEEDAQKQSRGLIGPFDLIKKLFKFAGRPIFTYGTQAPNEDTIGQVYLQHYDTEPETDYVTMSGVDGIWNFLVYKSGKVHCWCSYKMEVSVNSPVGNGLLFASKASEAVSYPAFIKFDKVPVETVSLKTAKNKMAWVASINSCTKSHTGSYKIISCDKHDTATFYLDIDVKGSI